MSPADILSRAERAKRILDDPLVIEAFALLESEIIDQWEACPARDKEAREFLWMYFKNARKFKGILQGAIETGRFEKLSQQESSVFSKLRKVM